MKIHTHSKAEARKDAALSSEIIEAPSAFSARSLSIHLYHRSFYSLRQFSVPLNFVPPIVSLCIAGGGAHAMFRFCRMAVVVVLSCCSLVHYRPSFPFSAV